jgi:hypothetical protein
VRAGGARRRRRRRQQQQRRRRAQSRRLHAAGGSQLVENAASCIVDRIGRDTRGRERERVRGFDYGTRSSSRRHFGFGVRASAGCVATTFLLLLPRERIELVGGHRGNGGVYLYRPTPSRAGKEGETGGADYGFALTYSCPLISFNFSESNCLLIFQSQNWQSARAARPLDVAGVE